MKALALVPCCSDELLGQVGRVVAGDLVALEEVGDGAAVDVGRGQRLGLAAGGGHHAHQRHEALVAGGRVGQRVAQLAALAAWRCPSR
jgi:hypothetical protein